MKLQWHGVSKHNAAKATRCNMRVTVVDFLNAACLAPCRAWDTDTTNVSRLRNPGRHTPQNQPALAVVAGTADGHELPELVDQHLIKVVSRPY